MSPALTPDSGPERPRRAGRRSSASVALFGAGALLLLSACGSDSDASTDTSEVTRPAATTEAATPTTETPEDTTPANEPPATEPPAQEPAPAEPAAMDPPVETGPLTETVIAEGTAARVEGSQINAPAAPDGRVPTSSRTIYEGDLVGEMVLTGSFLAGDETVESLTRGDFTGELVGIGSGTFVTEATTTMQIIDQTGETTGTIISGTGVFENVTGTSTLSSTGFGENFTYRFEFIPGGRAAAGPSSDALEGAAVLDEIFASIESGDFDATAAPLGTAGTWVPQDGEVLDAATIASYFESFDFIEHIARTGRSVELPEGTAHEVSESFAGGVDRTVWILVSSDDAGALVFTELAAEPQG